MLFRSLFISLFLFPCYLVSQNIGLHPPKIDWQQINTDTVRVIFPAGYEAQAQRTAKLIHELQAKHNESIGDKYYKFDLVLQTENITPNAYVGLAPFRSEFYTTPPQSFNLLGLTDWNELLTIHEFRHVQQASNERRGLTKLASLLQGQYGWAVLSGMATPNWFSEGDAVFTETALTNSGRGRLPAFTRTLRAMESEGIRYSYAKSRNGSYRDLVPSHYPYGYLHNVYARKKFGNNIWSKVLADGAAYKSLFYPFSRALKRHTGLTTKALYAASLDDYSASLGNVRSKSATTRLSPEHREPANYRFPHPQEDGSIIALRTTYKQTATVVRITADEKVETIAEVGFQREPYLDVRDGLAVWTEIAQNPRWQNESYSNIVVCNLKTGAKRKITSKGHYLSPSLSFDRKKIVAATYHPARGAALVVMDAKTQPQIDTILQDKGVFFAWPVFSANGDQVYALKRKNSQLAIIGKGIAEKTASPFSVTPFSNTIMDNLSMGSDGWLYYTSPLDGMDNIYRINPDSKEVVQLTDVSFGAYQPGVGKEGQLVFTTAGANGLYLASQSNFTPVDIKQNQVSPSTNTVYAAEGQNILDHPINREDFPSKNFSDHFGGIKLHSWSYNGSYVQPGFRAEATNALSTISLGAELSYNYNESRTSGNFNVSYGGLYPLVGLSGRYNDRSTLVQSLDFQDSLVVNRMNFKQFALELQAQLPLRWLSGNYVIDLQPAIDISRLQLSQGFQSGLNSLGGHLVFQFLRRRALRQVQPRFGLSFRLFSDKILNKNNSGGRLLIRSKAYLPGILQTHGISIDLDFQREKLVNPYQYPDGLQYARGFYTPFNDQAYRLGLNYQLPVVYPDFGIAGITYFKRIRLNGFYDIGSFRINQLNRNFDMRSAGAEVFFDNVWLNTQELTIGIQATKRLTRDFFAPQEESDWRFRVLFSGSF